MPYLCIYDAGRHTQKNETFIRGCWSTPRCRLRAIVLDHERRNVNARTERAGRLKGAARRVLRSTAFECRQTWRQNYDYIFSFFCFFFFKSIKKSNGWQTFCRFSLEIAGKPKTSVCLPNKRSISR